LTPRLSGSIPSANERGCQITDTHVSEHQRDRRGERAHVSGIEAADAADAKALRHRELARVDDEAALLQQGIKTLEDEACVSRHVECHDDRALQALWEQRLETERAHAINQHPAVLLVAPGAAGLTAFGPEVDERLTKRRNHMGWRGEAVLLAGKEG